MYAYYPQQLLLLGMMFIEVVVFAGKLRNVL